MSEAKLQLMADFIRESVIKSGIPPSFSEILQYMGMSNSVGYRYLLTLRDRGIIEYNGRGTLAISGNDTYSAKFHQIPVVGIVTCGNPEDNREEILGYLAIPEDWIDGECFFLQTSGDSMIDVGIEPGDLVLVKRVSSARDGQIVAVLTESGTTLKRYKTDNAGKPWLLAENRNYPSQLRELHPAEITIQGLATKIIKDIRNA